MEAVFALVQFHAEAVTAVGGPAAAAPNVGFMAHRAADPHVLSRLLKVCVFVRCHIATTRLVLVL